MSPSAFIVNFELVSPLLWCFHCGLWINKCRPGSLFVYSDQVSDRSSIKMMKNSKYGWLYFCMTKTLTLNVRNRFGWLGRVTTLWGSLNHLISHLFFNTFLIGYQHSTCHCGIPHSSSATESTLPLYAIHCHCNIS